MLAASLVCFSMITVLAAVAHAFHRARRAPEVLVGHGLGLTAVILLVVGDAPVGAVFTGYAIAMLLALVGRRPGVIGLIVRVGGAVAMSAAVAVDTLALLGHPAPFAAWALSAAAVLMAALTLGLLLRDGRPAPQRVATVVALLLLAVGGALAPHGAAGFVLPLLPAHALVTLLRVAPERLPALADVVTAILAALLAAAAGLATGAAPSALPLLAGAVVFAVSALARLLVGNARAFPVDTVSHPARPVPQLPLADLEPIHDRFPVAAPARGRASVRSLLEDAVEGATGRFLLEDETEMQDAGDVRGDLPPIVSALRSALNAASDDEEVVRVTLRGDANSVAIELDHALPDEIAERARGLLAGHGGRVLVSLAPEQTTQIVIPARPRRGEA